MFGGRGGAFSRRALAPELCPWPPSKKKRGTAHREARSRVEPASIRDAGRLSARRPVLSRPPGHAFSKSLPFVFKGRSRHQPAPGRGSVVPPGGAPAPPGNAALLRPHPRTPSRSPRAGATGSRPLIGAGRKINSPSARVRSRDKLGKFYGTRGGGCLSRVQRGTALCCAAEPGPCLLEVSNREPGSAAHHSLRSCCAASGERVPAW
jgi:hypothetical protein